MAGGILVALGLDGGGNGAGRELAGAGLGTGIHGGAIYLRGDVPDHYLGVGAVKAAFDEGDRKTLEPVLREFGECFGVPQEVIWDKPFTKVVPASARPYGSYYCGKLI